MGMGSAGILGTPVLRHVKLTIDYRNATRLVKMLEASRG
jgi:hypothetical protein